ncbi:MAG TPA: YtxH domain-containing protein [Candidatus Krumholzibacteria bacterium]
MEHNNGVGSRGPVAVAFLMGALAGGITAMLFAPQTVARMRGQIKRGAPNLRERGGNPGDKMQNGAGRKRRAAPRSAVVKKGEQT